ARHSLQNNSADKSKLKRPLVRDENSDDSKWGLPLSPMVLFSLPHTSLMVKLLTMGNVLILYQNKRRLQIMNSLVCSSVYILYRTHCKPSRYVTLISVRHWKGFGVSWCWEIQF
ncbi:unnamed protein product, partial [Urochloa humidicola]